MVPKIFSSYFQRGCYQRERKIITGVLVLVSYLTILLLAWTLRERVMALDVLMFFLSPLSPAPLSGIIAWVYGYPTSCKKMAFTLGATPVFLGFFLNLEGFFLNLAEYKESIYFLPGSLLPSWTSLLGVPGCGYLGYGAALIKVGEKERVAGIIIMLSGLILWFLSIIWWWGTVT